MCQSLRYSRQESHYHAKRYSARQATPRRLTVLPSSFDNKTHSSSLHSTENTLYGHICIQFHVIHSTLHDDNSTRNKTTTRSTKLYYSLFYAQTINTFCANSNLISPIILKSKHAGKQSATEAVLALCQNPPDSRRRRGVSLLQ